MKKMDRELGLFSVFAISCGAMLGPGIFVLPGLTFTIGGAASILAYITAGLLVIPAALSQAEMSTALPQSGGPYLFLDRSLGPLAGTLSGLGTWISLILKSAFSLVGLGAYLMFFTGLPPSYAVQVGVGIAIFLILLNALGAKKAGQVQSVLVIVTLFVLIDFVGWGSIEVQRSHYHPFFSKGVLGFFGATAFCYVSYAGIAKVVSVAEEIKNPGRNIPWGIMLSLLVTILVYGLVVYVIVGVVPGDELGHGPYKLMPLVQAGEELGGYWGMEIMAGIAVLALASMANAGLMAASRFPLPLARDHILPPVLSRISPRFSTPVISIFFTGSILIAFILFLPVKNLAKLGSAFLLIVFGLINLAVIIFRESEIEWYSPDFYSPLYPFLQLFGFISCFSLIFLMGWFPVIGAGVLVGGCLLWYFLYARSRVDREGAFFRSAADDEEVELFQGARTESSSNKESVIVPFFGLQEADMLHVERRIRLAASLCDSGERLDVVDFIEVPEQSFLSGFDPEEDEYRVLQQRAEMLDGEIDNEIHVDQVITHNSRGALRNYAEDENPHWVVLDWQEPSPWQILIGSRKWWLDDFPCDTLFFDDREVPDFESLIVLTEPGAYDGEVVYAADHIARFFDGEVTFLNPLIRDNRKAYDFVRSYQEELEGMCSVKTHSETISAEHWVDEVVSRTQASDLLVVGGLSNERYEQFPSKRYGEQIIDDAECSVARIRSTLQSPQSVLQKYGEDFDEGELREQFEGLNYEREVEIEDKSELFEQLGDFTPEQSDEVEKALWDRENIQNTYLENGVAFPHALLESFDRTGLYFVVPESPFEYAEDGEEAEVVVAIVGPTEERHLHLELIGKLTEMFVEGELKEVLLEERHDPKEWLIERI
jgi:amino acid transporter/mannitol/fructose-specific phosphotransferase system IIA component (Ntr-type)